jgi:hypothetical protein
MDLERGKEMKSFKIGGLLLGIILLVSGCSLSA